MEQIGKQIAAALVKAQKGFAPALKTSTNPHFRSKYAGLDACVEAVIDSLNENGIALIQHTFECDSGVMVETVFLHESGEYMPCGKLHVPASKQDAQGYGSALTYARRYSLMAACGIAPEDDDGNAATKKPKDDGFPKQTQKITATAGAFESLDANTQNVLLETAKDIESCYESDINAAIHIYANAIKNDDGSMDETILAALRGILSSKCRSAMQKEQQRRKDMANQA